MTDSGVSSYRLDLKNPETLEELVRTHREPLIRYAYSITGDSAAAEDAMEDAFAVLIVKGGRFDSPQQLRSWLYKTTRSRAIDHLRRHKRDVPLCDVENVLCTGGPEADYMVRQRNEKLYLCLQQLPQQYREVLQLCYLEGFEIPQICRILRKTAKQVYNLLARAKQAMRENLIREGMNYEDLR